MSWPPHPALGWPAAVVGGMLPRTFSRPKAAPEYRVTQAQRSHDPQPTNPTFCWVGATARAVQQ